MQTFFDPLRASLGEWWISGRGHGVRFLGHYFRLPLLLIAAAFLLEEFIYHAVLPLSGIAEGEADYLVARCEVARGDDPAALGSIRAALLHTRGDPAFWKLSAEISGRLHSPEETYCWEQLDRLRPGSFSTQIQLAQSAMSYRQLDVVAAALYEVAAADQSALTYQQVAGELADASGESQRAREYFSQVEAAHPVDAPSLFALARWHAESSDPAELKRARGQLISLASRPDSANEARRLLVGVALKLGDRVEAKKWSDDLLGSGHATLADRLQRLDVLPKAAAKASLQELLAAPERQDVAPLAESMLAHGHAEEALSWIRSQSPEIQNDPRVCCARADCLSALGLWEQLRDAQLAENWPGWQVERLMYLSRADSETNREVDARAAWSQAVLACHDYPDYLKLLDYLAKSGPADPASFRSDARAQVLTQMLARNPGQAWIVRTLLQESLGRHDSLQVANYWGTLAAIDPGDIDAAANAARIGLLRGSRVGKASARLQFLLAQNPANAAVVTASAYDLYRQAKFGDAMALLGGLSAEELGAPECAPYLAALLAVAGPLDQAAERVRGALALPGLLPEEHALLDRSAQLIEYRKSMAALLHPSAPVSESTSEDFPALILSTNQVPAIYLVGQSVAFSRSANPKEAALVLSGIDLASLDPAALSIYLGGILDLAGRREEALPYLELSTDLPFQTATEKFHQAVDLWWKLRSGSPDDSSFLAGLLGAYRGLDRCENNGAFWRRDQAREMDLIRRALLRGSDVAAVQERLHGLLLHVPATPEMQVQDAYAILLRGQPRAARERMNVLAPSDLAQAEPSLYYGIILAACGERRAAQFYLRLALKSALIPEETQLGARAERMP